MHLELQAARRFRCIEFNNAFTGPGGSSNWAAAAELDWRAQRTGGCWGCPVEGTTTRSTCAQQPSNHSATTSAGCHPAQRWADAPAEQQRPRVGAPVGRGEGGALFGLIQNKTGLF